MTRSISLMNIAAQLLLHNYPMDSKLLDFNSGRICAFLARILNLGMFIVVVCKEDTCLLVGRITYICLLVHTIF